MHTDSSSVKGQTVALLQSARSAACSDFAVQALRYVSRANGFYHGMYCPHGEGSRIARLSQAEALAVRYATSGQCSPDRVAERSQLIQVISDIIDYDL
jgi:hypothetical protein